MSTYTKKSSILNTIINDYELTKNEYVILYKFYLTHSIISELSFLSFSLIDYGWSDNNIKKTKLYKKVKKFLEINPINYYIISGEEKETILQKMKEYNLLSSGNISDFSERIVIYNKLKDSCFHKMIKSMRNILAHGRYVLKINNNIKYIIYEDHNGSTLTSRAIVKIDTLIKFAELVSKGYF